MGCSVRVKKISCEVVGVLTAKGQSGFGSDQDDMVGHAASAPFSGGLPAITQRQHHPGLGRERVADESSRRNIERLLREPPRHPRGDRG